MKRKFAVFGKIVLKQTKIFYKKVNQIRSKMVENYFNNGRSRRIFRANSEQRRSFDCKPQQNSTTLANRYSPCATTSRATIPSTAAAAREMCDVGCCPPQTTNEWQTIRTPAQHMRLSSASRTNCGPYRSASFSSAPAAVRDTDDKENYCCPAKTNDCRQTTKLQHRRSSSLCNSLSSSPSPSPSPLHASLSPTRFASCKTSAKSRCNELNSFAGVLSSSARSSPSMLQRDSGRPSASSLKQYSLCNQNTSANNNTNTNARCCCCTQCGKPQEPSQVTPACCTPSPPQHSLPCSRPKTAKTEQISPETEYKCRMRKLQLENLVKDQYCPGVIQSTIDCEVDFNEMSFRLVFGCAALPSTKPTIEPISLIEALCMRVELERCLLKHAEHPQRRSGLMMRHSSTGTDEVDAFFSRKYKTPLNEALANLLRAEMYYSAENPNEGTLKMNAEIEKTCTSLPDSCFKITAFTGKTKPI